MAAPAKTTTAVSLGASLLHTLGQLRGQSITVRVILFYTLCKGLTLSLYGLIFPLYLYSLGYRQDRIGLISAAPAITILIFGLPIGLLADRVGRKPVLLIGCILTPPTVLGIALSHSMVWLIIWSLLNGLVATTYWVTAFPLLTENSTPETRVGLFAINSVLLWGAGALGGAIGGGITQMAAQVLHQSATSPRPLQIALLATVVIYIIGIPPLFAVHAPAAAPPVAAEPGGRRDPVPVGLFARLLVPDVLLTFGNGAMVGFLQLYFVQRFGVAVGVLGSFLAIVGFAGGLMSLSAPAITERLGTARSVIAVLWFTIPVVVAEGVLPVAALALAAEALRTCLRSISDPIYTTFVMERVSASQRGRLSGMLAITYSVGFSLGPAASGWVQVQAHSFLPAFLLASGCFTLAGTLFALFFGRVGAEQGEALTAH